MQFSCKQAKIGGHTSSTLFKSCSFLRYGILGLKFTLQNIEQRFFCTAASIYKCFHMTLIWKYFKNIVQPYCPAPFGANSDLKLQAIKSIRF